MKLFQPKYICCLTLISFAANNYAQSEFEWVIDQQVTAADSQHRHVTQRHSAEIAKKNRAKQLALAEQQRKAQQLALAEQQRKAQQFALAEQQRKAQQFALAEQQRKAQQFALAEQQRKAQQLALADQQRKAQQFALAEQQRKAQQLVWAQQQQRAQQFTLSEQQRGSQQQALTSQHPATQVKPQSNKNEIITKEPLNNPFFNSLLGSKVFTLSLGASWLDTSTVIQPFNSAIINTYTVHGNDAFVVGELFGGFERQISPGLNGQLGIAVALGGDAEISGNVVPSTAPGFNNYTYQYSVDRTYIGLKGKLLKEINSFDIKPYISASLGLSFNQAYQYSSNYRVFNVPVAPFASNTTEAFSYTVGAGIQKSFAAHWSTGIGYEFADWGRSSLGGAINNTANNLQRDHLYNNALLVNLSYNG